jgi:putative oxidoreductase
MTVMRDSINAAQLILRLALGVVFIAHGIKHAKGRVKTSNWFESIGFRKPEMQWFLSTATEIGVGVLMLIGFLTSLAAAGIVGIMGVAFLSVHRKAGFWITARPDEGWEYAFALSAMAAAVALTGPGEWSVDHAIDLASKLDALVGLALVAGGGAAAVAHMVVFFRPQTDGD